MTTLETTEDRWLGGRLTLLQPAGSYRVAIDAALLAAAVPLQPGARALELGTGVGAAALALATRVGDAQVTAVELQPALAALARDNARRNALADRVSIVEGDILDLPRPAAPFDAVFLNPPYLTPEANDPAADPIKRIATVEGAARLDDWLRIAAAQTATGAAVTVIHRADRLADLLAAATAAGLGGLTVFPLWPRLGEPARRVLVQGRKGKGGRLTMAPGLVLHSPDGAYTPEAEAALSGAPLSLIASPA